MYGFYIHTKSEKDSKQYSRNITFGNLNFGYISFEKFGDDKIFEENNAFIIGIDGVIFNKKALLNQHASKSYFDLIISLFQKENIQFVSQFKGVFSGFIFEKNTQKLYFFNNRTATKQVFYSFFNTELVIAPTIENIVAKRNKSNTENTLNIQAAYHLLAFGGMIENTTLIKDVFKLGAGEYLVYENNKLEVKRYYDFNHISPSIVDKNKAIKQIDEVFTEAVALEYQKDTEYNYKKLATLSGGLDSRMNVVLAEKQGNKPSVLCFSQTGYADQTIAKKIATDLNLDFKFVALDGGDYLKSLSEMVSINNGLQYYNGSAHYNYALKKIALKNYGLIHTGQIGDGILGGFVTGNPKNFLSKTVSNRFLHKTVVAKSILDSYRDEELYKLYQRVFNVANFGSYMVEQHQTYLVSPFLDEDVIRVALSIHPDLKINQDIYIDWINKLHPNVTKYKWERTGFRPNKRWKTALSRYTNKLKKEYHIFTKQGNKLSMNPTDYWYNTNPSIAAFYNDFYNTNNALLSNNSELQQDIKTMFTLGTLTEKALVLTLLEVLRKYQLKIE